jgi:glucose-6-phosphate isomerase
MNPMLNWKIRSHFKSTVDSQTLSETIDSYQRTLESEDIGFFRLPQDRRLLARCESLFNKFHHKKYFIHVGIGGSALGTEMLLSALGQSRNVKFTFINNIDPDDLSRKLEDINLHEALIYVVSKSGTTAETVAAMSIIIQKFKNLGITESEYNDYFVFCTDPQKGELRKISGQWDIETLEIPANVGGRFSVLTPVGLFPSLFAGINVLGLLEGAEKIKPHLFNKDKAQDFFELAQWIKALHDEGVQQTVMMPYSSLLREYSSWFVQLWAESLGKDGKGLTPIPAFGATDQHSQMQLFMEGPHDKILMILEVEKFHSDFSLNNDVESESFKNLSPFKLSDLMKAELEGTLTALEENKRHVVQIKLPILNEDSLGQLILFAECLTVIVGEFLQVNPFNQPGVEAGKKYANSWLKANCK